MALLLRLARVFLGLLALTQIWKKLVRAEKEDKCVKSVLDEIEIGQELSELDKDVLFIESVRFEPEFEDYRDFDLLVLRDDLFEVFFEYELDYDVDHSRLRTLIHEFQAMPDRAVKHFLSSCESVYGINKPLPDPEEEY